MKSATTIFSSVFSVFLVFVMMTSCEKLGPSDKGDEQASYPIRRLITDSTGRELQVEILGRSEDQISIVRQSDSSRFELPISKLSAADQSFVKRLPVKLAPKVKAEVSVASSSTPRYIEVRLEDIAEMEREIELKKAEIKSKTLDPILTNNRRTQIKALEKEVKRITLDIATYKRNNKL